MSSFEERKVEALESIAKSLEKLASPPIEVKKQEIAWLRFRDPKVVAEENKVT